MSKTTSPELWEGKSKRSSCPPPNFWLFSSSDLTDKARPPFRESLPTISKTRKKRMLSLVPADTYRPAAKEQLITLARNVSVPYFDSDLSQSPTNIVTKALEQAKNDRREVVIIDTAGRLHINDELMEELAQVRHSLKKVKTEVLLVADAMTGQEAVNVAESFHSHLELTGVVLSKMDSDARGGAALSIVQSTGVPIRYISTGEHINDLELFHPDRLASRILDMGDIVSLVEKAEEEMGSKIPRTDDQKSGKRSLQRRRLYETN